MVTIAVNTGYYCTKVKSKQREFAFESRLSKAHFKDSTFILDGEGYKLEEGAFNVEGEKSKNEIQRACMAYAIAKATQSNEVRVITTLPMAQYINKDARESYKEHLLQKIYINYPEERCIQIKEAIIFMEGAAAVYNSIDRFRGQLKGVIDWGGKTINAAIFEDCKPVSNTIITLDMGILILEEKIRNAINQKLQRNMQDYQMRYIYNTNNMEEKRIVEEVINDHVEELRQKLMLSNWDLKGIEVVGTGGGALKLEKYLKQSFHGIEISTDAQFENVRGLWNIAQVLGE